MIHTYRKITPIVPESAFVVESAQVIGDVVLGEHASVWFNAVVRGDVNSIRIGTRTNVQDGTVIHVTNKTHPTHIGEGVTIGHNCTLHGCTVEDYCLIGIGAIVLDGAVIGHESMVAAGSLVTPGTRIEPGSLVMGSPARVVRRLSGDEIAGLHRMADNYIGYVASYREQEGA
ncbi:MAG: gamma carbonic anhydrase family protein [Geothermobacteraceae bacterium]